MMALSKGLKFGGLIHQMSALIYRLDINPTKALQ